MPIQTLQHCQDDLPYRLKIATMTSYDATVKRGWKSKRAIPLEGATLRSVSSRLWWLVDGSFLQKYYAAC